MAPLPFNNTSVMTYEYSWPNGTGQFQIRFSEQQATDADVNSYVNGLLAVLDPVLSSGWSITGQRRQSQGAPFSLPVTPISFTSTAANVQDDVDRPLELSFQARSFGGRRLSLSVFGSRIVVPANYRIPLGIVVDIDAIIGYLSGTLAPGVHIAIDNLGVVWYQYANVNYNSYYERQARR